MPQECEKGIWDASIGWGRRQGQRIGHSTYHHLQLVGSYRSNHRGQIQNFVCHVNPNFFTHQIEKEEVALTYQKSSLSSSLDLSPSSLNTEVCFILQEMELATSPLKCQPSD
jgi:hypothetical protein